MAIVKMKKLRLIAMRSQKEELLHKLQLLGCIEISEPETPLEGDSVVSLAEAEASSAGIIKEKQASLLRAIAILDAYASVKSPLFAALPDVRESDFFNSENEDNMLILAEKLENSDAKIRRIITEDAREHALIESLLPWEELKIPLNFEGTKDTGAFIGTVPVSVSLQELELELSAKAPESQVFSVSSGKELHYLFIICHKDTVTQVSEILRAFSFSSSALKNTHGTAQENIKAAEQRITNLQTEREQLTAEIIAEAQNRQNLKLAADLAAQDVQKSECAGKLLSTKSAVILYGWLEASAETALSETLSQYDCAWETEEPEVEEYGKVPVKLNNNKFSGPLNMVTNMYSLPAYGGVDPNPLMAPFFIIFYGFMMADMGYGLVMLIGSLFVKSKKLRPGAIKDLFDLMFPCSISTFVFGLLTGGFFGDAPTQVASIFGGNFALAGTIKLGSSLIKYPLFSPVDDAMMVLVAAFVMGFIHIIFGMGINIVHQAKQGHLFDGLCDNVPWWILFAGIAVGALGGGWIVTIAGVVLIDLAGGRNKPSIFGKLFGGLGKLYDITSYFGDILSYSRLMALMLAGGVIANVFNTLGGLTGNIITFLLIFLIGHSLNIGLNLLGCYVHDLRLQCLEFFGKFYQDGGRPFRPFRINSKYVNITNK